MSILFEHIFGTFFAEFSTSILTLFKTRLIQKSIKISLAVLKLSVSEGWGVEILF